MRTPVDSNKISVVESISFFNNVELFSENHKKNGLLVFWDSANMVIAFCKNNKKKMPFYNVRYLSDSLFLITRTVEERYTVSDSILFYGNFCLYKREDYDRRRPGDLTAFNERTFMSRRIWFYVLGKNEFNAYTGTFFKDKYQQFDQPLFNVMENCIGKLNTGKLGLDFWQQKAFNTPDELQSFKWTFLKQYINYFLN